MHHLLRVRSVLGEMAPPCGHYCVQGVFFNGVCGGISLYDFTMSGGDIVVVTGNLIFPP